MTNRKIIFFGNERLVSGLPSSDAPILRGLIDAGYDIVAIVSHHTEAKSRNARPLEVAELAQQHKIPLHLPEKPLDIYAELVAYNADAAILVAYGRIIPQKVIDIFPLGIINVHPSLLPKYRGPTPIESPILNGDDSTGVSIMLLTAGMDEGPVFVQDAFPIEATDTKFEIYERAKKLSCRLLLEVLPAILDKTLTPTAQDHTKATYSSLLNKADGVLDPLLMTATQAERMVRAYLGFPKTRMVINETPIIVTKAHTSDEERTLLDVTFSDGVILSIDEVIAPSGKRMDAASFLRGYAT